MVSKFSLLFYLNIYHTSLGLKKAVVFAEAVEGYEDLLFNCLKTNDFWLYVNRCYGKIEGCLGVYAIPKNHCDEFEQYIRQFEESSVACNVQIFWSTCFQSVHSKCNWFNAALKTWDFPWHEWIAEIPKEETQLPFTLQDPEDFPLRGDRVDILILKELEKNPLLKFTDLAKTIGISQQLVGYHYLKHVLGRGLVESFETWFPYFDKNASDMFIFVFKFNDHEAFARFAASLLDKPFVRGLGKVLGQNALIAHLYFPRVEFRNFIDALSALIRVGFLQSYSYVIQDLGKTARQTISYEYFKDKKWVYDHQKHIKNLDDLVKGRGLEERLTPALLG